MTQCDYVDVNGVYSAGYDLADPALSPPAPVSCPALSPEGFTFVPTPPEDGVNQRWDFVNSAWYWPKTALHNVRISNRNTLINTPITTNGVTLAATDDNIARLEPFADDAENEEGGDSRALNDFGMSVSVDLTNTQFLEVFNALKARNQLIKDVDVSVRAGIEGATLTTPSAVDSAFPAGLSSPPVTRTALPKARDILAAMADKTNTSTGTTGNRTINKRGGSVNFAASDTLLVITNSLVDANSIVVATVATNDSNMSAVKAVAGAGTITLYPDVVPAAETRVNFYIAS